MRGTAARSSSFELANARYRQGSGEPVRFLVLSRRLSGAQPHPRARQKHDTVLKEDAMLQPTAKLVMVVALIGAVAPGVADAQARESIAAKGGKLRVALVPVDASNAKDV